MLKGLKYVLKQWSHEKVGNLGNEIREAIQEVDKLDDKEIQVTLAEEESFRRI